MDRCSESTQIRAKTQTGIASASFCVKKFTRSEHWELPPKTIFIKSYSLTLFHPISLLIRFGFAPYFFSLQLFLLNGIDMQPLQVLYFRIRMYDRPAFENIPPANADLLSCNLNLEMLFKNLLRPNKKPVVLVIRSTIGLIISPEYCWLYFNAFISFWFYKKNPALDYMKKGTNSSTKRNIFRLN